MRLLVVGRLSGQLATAVKMAMAHGAQVAPVGGARRGHVAPVPLGRRKGQRAAQQPLGRAVFQHKRIALARQLDHALTRGLGGLGGLAGQFGRDPLGAGVALGLDGADDAGGAAGRADGRAQVHHRLREIACARVRRDRVGRRAYFC